MALAILSFRSREKVARAFFWLCTAKRDLACMPVRIANASGMARKGEYQEAYQCARSLRDVCLSRCVLACARAYTQYCLPLRSAHNERGAAASIDDF